MARKIKSRLFQGTREQFQSGGGKYWYSPGTGSHYLENKNNLEASGTIFIDPDHARRMIRYYGDLEGSVRAILIHEMGHFIYRVLDRTTQPRKATEIESTVSWCLKREAHASMFAYRVVKEMKARDSSSYVIAPTPTADLFSVLVEAERTGKNARNLAINTYSSNPEYAAYCRDKLLPRAKPGEEIPTVIIKGKRPSKKATSAEAVRP